MENEMEAGASQSETPSCLTTCDSGPSHWPSQVFSGSSSLCQPSLSSTCVCFALHTHTALSYFSISGPIALFACSSKVAFFYITVPISESPSLATEMD